MGFVDVAEMSLSDSKIGPSFADKPPEGFGIDEQVIECTGDGGSKRLAVNDDESY